MKVLIENNKILKFGKDIQPEKADGEYIGIAKFNKNDAEIIFNKMEKLINEGKTDIWYELAINDALNKIIAKPIYTNGLPWIEIDTKEDYQSIRFHIDIKDFEPFSVIKVLFKASIKKLLNANKDHYPIIDFKFNDAREIEDKIDFKRFYDFGANYIIKEFYNKYKDTEFENNDLVYFRIDLNIDYDTIVISNPFISILKEGV